MSDKYWTIHSPEGGQPEQHFQLCERHAKKYSHDAIQAILGYDYADREMTEYAAFMEGASVALDNGGGVYTVDDTGTCEACDGKIGSWEAVGVA